MPTSRKALSASFVDVNNAVNGGGPFVGKAPDGTVITIPGGPEAVWPQSLQIDKSVTIVGAGVGNTIISYGVTLNTAPPLFDVTLTTELPDPAYSFRLSGMTIKATAGSVVLPSEHAYIKIVGQGDASTYVAGCISRVRVDNMNWDVSLKGLRMITDSVLGVADHIVGVANSIPFVKVEHNNWTPPGTSGLAALGYGSWADYIYWGSDKFWFFEDCKFTLNAGGSGNGICDNEEAGRTVWRYCTFAGLTDSSHPVTALGGLASHGLEGRTNPGVRASEVYHCDFRINRSFAQTARSGSLMWWNNHSTAASSDEGFQIYREFQAYPTQWGGADGTNRYDHNDPTTVSTPLYSGTVTSNSGGSSGSLNDFTDSNNSDNFANINLTDGAFYAVRNLTEALPNSNTDGGHRYKVCGVSGKPGSKRLNLIASGTVSQGDIVSPTWHNGDAYEIRRVFRILGQPGGPKWNLLKTSATSPSALNTYPYPNTSGTKAQDPSAGHFLEPCYSFNNWDDTFGRRVLGAASCPSLLANRDYFNLPDFSFVAREVGYEHSSYAKGASDGNFPISIKREPDGAAHGYTPWDYPHPLTNPGVATLPNFTSDNHTTFVASSAGTFDVVTTGTATIVITKTGSLPSGVTLTDNTDGTATLAGTTATTGTFVITISATNSAGTTTQSFTLTVTPSATRIIGLAGSMSFGDVDINTTKTLNLTLTNSGNSTLTVSSITLPSGFTADWTSGTIAVGVNQLVVVTFSPIAATSYSGTITVASDKTSGTNTTSASGVGVTRIIALSGDLGFGTITTGQMASRTLTITNNGNRALTVSSASYPQGFSGDYAGGSIAAGASVLDHVTFSPTLAQAYSGNVSFVTNKTSGTSTFAASGTGTAAATKIIQLTGSLAFGSVLDGTTLTKVLTIKNSGNTTLTVTDLTVPSGYSSDWTAGTIAAGASQTANITFSPIAATTYNGTLSVTSDATGGISSATITGTGTAATTKIIALTGNMIFGNVNTGTTVTRVLTITNSGTAVLTVSSITLPTGFTGSYSGTIDPGASQDVNITFSPVLNQLYSGTITVVSDKTSGTNTKAASGTGVAPATKVIGLSGDLAFGNVQKNHTAQRTFTINNSGTSVLTVSNITSPTGFTTDITTATIAAGGSQNVVVTFSPIAVQAYGGTITVVSNATSGIDTIGCTGNGTNKKQVPFVLIVG